jgi:hypothetical protein
MANVIKEEKYEEIFESYSKIWRNANLAEFEKQREQGNNERQQINQIFSQFYNSFAPV